MTTHGMTPYHPNPQTRDHSDSPGLAGMNGSIRAGASLRCSVILVRDGQVLLVPRDHGWTLPGGPVWRRETLTDCGRREAGLAVELTRCLLVLEHAEVAQPATVELVFSATCDPAMQPTGPAQFLPLVALPGLRVWPPVVAQLLNDDHGSGARYVRQSHDTPVATVAISD